MNPVESQRPAIHSQSTAYKRRMQYSRNMKSGSRKVEVAAAFFELPRFLESV